MARIRKDDHPRILRMIEVEHLKVADVAAEFGCTPANIYAVVAKARRQNAASAAPEPVQPPLALDEVAPAAPVPASATLADAAPDVATSAATLVEAVAEQGASGEDGTPVPEANAQGIPAAAGSAPLGSVAAAGKATAAAKPSQGAARGAGSKGTADRREDSSSPGAEPNRNVVAFEAAPAAAAARPGRAAGGRRGGAGAVGAKLAKPGYGLVMRTPEGEESLTPFRSLDDLLSAIKPILRAAASSPEPVWFSLQPVDLASIDMDAA